MTHSARGGFHPLLALGLGLIVAACTISGDASAKAADKVGETPTDAYSDGRGANLASDVAGPSYKPGIGYDIPAIIHFHQNK